MGIACIARYIKLCGEQLALAQLGLDMYVRCAACISGGPQGAKAVTAITARNDAAKALKTLVSIAAVARVMVMAVVIALPYFNRRASNRLARQVADVALEPSALAFGVVLATVAQQVKVLIFGQGDRVKRAFRL